MLQVHLTLYFTSLRSIFLILLVTSKRRKVRSHKCLCFELTANGKHTRSESKLTLLLNSPIRVLFTAVTWSVLFNQEHLVYQTVCIEMRINSTDPVLTSNQTQYLLKYSLDFVFSFVSGHSIIHWFRTIDYCVRFSFYPLTYVNFLHILDNDDMMSSKRRNLSALVFLIKGLFI